MTIQNFRMEIVVRRGRQKKPRDQGEQREDEYPSHCLARRLEPFAPPCAAFPRKPLLARQPLEPHVPFLDRHDTPPFIPTSSTTFERSQ